METYSEFKYDIYKKLILKQQEWNILGHVALWNTQVKSIVFITATNKKISEIKNFYE